MVRGAGVRRAAADDRPGDRAAGRGTAAPARAAAAPPPPPPAVQAPKPPDIVTERLEERKLKEQQEQARLEKAKLDQQKAEQAKADAEKKQAAQQKQLDAQKLAKLHDENLKRMMGQMNAPANATGTAARDSGPVALARHSSAPSSAAFSSCSFASFTASSSTLRGLLSASALLILRVRSVARTGVVVPGEGNS